MTALSSDGISARYLTPAGYVCTIWYMGWLRSLRALFSADDPVHTFDVSIDNVIDSGDVAALFRGYADDWVSVAWKVTRPMAMQCGAVVRARDAICGTIGRLPLYAMSADFTRSTRPLLEQPERDIPAVITMTRTVEDLLFGSNAWWRVVERDYAGFPTKVRRLDPDSVDIREDSRIYVRPDGTPQGHATEYVPDADLIRFYSPTDGLLTSAARAIRTLLKLEAAAAMDADSPAPRIIFTPKDGFDPTSLYTPTGEETDEELQAAQNAAVAAALASFKAARQQSVDAYVGAAWDVEKLSWSPAERQLVEARNAAVLEIARFTGLDPYDLAASTIGTTSMDYANQQDRRTAFVDGACAVYIAAIQDRLSMGDVTPRGTKVRIDVEQYEQADPTTRLANYEVLQRLRLADRKELLRREELPEPQEEPMPAAPTTQPTVEPGRPLRAVAASADGVYTFDAEPDGLTLGFASDPVAVDVAARTITGLAVPWGAVATKNGQRFTFARGSITWDPARMPKVLIEHNRASAVGKVVELTETDAGLRAVLRIARGPEGDRALQLAEDGVLDGLSVGVAGQFERRAGVNHAKATRAAEISLTPFPAFDTARVDSVAASADDLEGTMPPTGTVTEEAPATEPVTFSAEQFAELIGRFGNPQAGPEVIAANPSGTVQLAAADSPYCFDGSKGEHDFSRDLIAWSRGDGEAAGRVTDFITAEFNVAQANVSSLNPLGQRPDLYVDNLEFRYPVWSAIVKGTLSDITAFRIPKWATSSGMVADHVPGVEPTAGAFTTGYQDITPTAMSGKVVIDREVWDQGGNPQLSMILWREIQRAWYEALEVKAVDMLDALTPTAIALSGVDADLAGAWSDALSDLQYIRGGYRFDDFVLAKNLFKGFTGAVDDNGRRLYPMVNPQNANGSTDRRYRFIDADGVIGNPAWALEAGNGGGGSSYLFAREDVHGWATPPRRIDMPAIAVATVTIGVWGYVAAANTRLEGVREVTYSG